MTMSPRPVALTRAEVEHLGAELRPLGELALQPAEIEALSGLRFEEYQDDLGSSRDLVVRLGERLFALVQRPDAPVADRIVVLASDALTPSALVEIVVALGLPQHAIVGVSNGRTWLAPTGT